MTPDEIDRIVFRVAAAWPRPPIPIETLSIWHEHLRPLTFKLAWDGVLLMERTRARQPSLAEFHEAYNAVRPTGPSTHELEADEEWVGSEQAKENLAILRDMLLGIRPRLDSFMSAPVSRKGAQKYSKEARPLAARALSRIVLRERTLCATSRSTTLTARFGRPRDGTRDEGFAMNENDVSSVEADELADHVSGVLFDATESYEPDCMFCQRAKALGLFAAYGYTDEDLAEMP